MSVPADLTRGAMTEFQEKLRKQHEELMHRELEALLTTADKTEAEVRETVARGVRANPSPFPSGGVSFSPLPSVCSQRYSAHLLDISIKFQAHG